MNNVQENSTAGESMEEVTIPEAENMQPSTGAELAAPAKSLEGIRGWLILPLLSLFIIPLRTVFYTMTYLVPAMSKEVWLALTTPGSEAYHHLWGPVLIFEMSGNLTVFVFSVLLLVLFFKKSRLLPKFYISFLVFNMAFVVGDYFLVNQIPFVAAQDDPETAGEVVKAISHTAIWVPYFLVSKRVKATFVR